MELSPSAPEPEVSPEKEPASLTASTDVVRLIDSAENELDPPLVDRSISSPTDGVPA